MHDLILSAATDRAHALSALADAVEDIQEPMVPVHLSIDGWVIEGLSEPGLAGRLDEPVAKQALIRQIEDRLMQSDLAFPHQWAVRTSQLDCLLLYEPNH